MHTDNRVEQWSCMVYRLLDKMRGKDGRIFCVRDKLLNCTGIRPESRGTEEREAFGRVSSDDYCSSRLVKYERNHKTESHRLISNWEPELQYDSIVLWLRLSSSQWKSSIMGYSWTWSTAQGKIHKGNRGSGTCPQTQNNFTSVKMNFWAAQKTFYSLLSQDCFVPHSQNGAWRQPWLQWLVEYIYQ